MNEFSTRAPGPPDGLFLDRLDTFMDKCLADIKAFSEREFLPFEETRQHVAEWHLKYLFQPQSTDSAGTKYSAAKVRSVLCDTSRMLETLCEVSGVQSFVLAVDPNTPSDMGFLGGSILGREFWRGMRNGGDAGAKAFKTYSIRDLESQTMSSLRDDSSSTSRASSASVKLPPARSVKNDLYENVRKALRSVSGIRNAEMKWTNPERLDVYGIRLVGWPASIPSQNPSTLKAGQNKILLKNLENGTMRFEKLIPVMGTSDYTKHYNTEDGTTPDETEETDDFSWAYDANAGDPPPGDVGEALSTHITSEHRTTHFHYQAPDILSQRVVPKNLWDPNIATLDPSGTMSSSRKRPRSNSDQE